jgi:hypothetical protein
MTRDNVDTHVHRLLPTALLSHKAYVMLPKK